MIQIRNLHKAFGDNQVLRGVNLTVEKGETMVVIGQSGSGKSVLIKHIIGLLKPDLGEIWVDGVDMTRLDEDELQGFIRELLPYSPTVTVRRSKGPDIFAACGQLWTESLGARQTPPTAGPARPRQA